MMLKLSVSKFKKYQLKELLLIYAGLIVLAIPTILIPLFSSGFIGDDTLSSLVRATLQLNQETIVGQYIENFNVMKTSRVTLLQPYYFLFLLIGGEIIYLKLWVTVIMITLIFTIYHFCKYFSIGISNSIIAAASFIAMLQFRDYGDPVLAFYGITPLSILGLLWAIICLRELFNDNNGIIKLAVINLIIIISGQLYEFNIVILSLVLITFIRSLNNNIFNVFKKILPAIIFFTAFFIASIYFRFFSEVVNPEYQSAYSPSLNPLVFFKTVAIQLISSIPFSNILFDKITYKFGLMNVYFGVLLFFAFFVFLLLIRKLVKNNSSNNDAEESNFSKESNLLFLALYLILIPTFLIALSPKYQSETSFGNPYTNSLYFIVGLSIAVGVLAGYLKKTFGILCFFLAISFGINYVGNQDIVNKINEFWDNPRSTAVLAMRNGIFSDLPQHPVILTSINYPWSIAPFYKQYSNVVPDQLFYQGAPGMIFSPRKNTINPLSGVKHNFLNSESALLDDFPYLKSNLNSINSNYHHFLFKNDDSKAYFFNYSLNQKDSGVVSVCRIKEMTANQNEFASVLCDEFSIFYRHKKNINFNSDNFTVNLDAYDIQSSKKIGHFEIDQSSFITKRFKNGILLKYKAREKSILIDGKSIHIKYENPWISKSVALKKDFFNGLNSEGIEFEKSTLSLMPVNDNLSTRILINFSLGRSLNAFQPEFSHIAGNHPGAGFQGFVLQKVFNSVNEYEFTYGNGKEWKSFGKIIINDLNIHTLDIRISNNEIELSFDNKKIGYGNDYVNSLLPLQIGGLQSGGRNFIGKFYGVKVSTN